MWACTFRRLPHIWGRQQMAQERRQSDGAVGFVKPQTGMFLRGFDMSPGFRKEV